MQSESDELLEAIDEEEKPFSDGRDKRRNRREQRRREKIQYDRYDLSYDDDEDNYSFDLDAIQTDDDLIFEAHGVKVVIDDMSLEILGSAEVDFVEDLIGSAFKLNIPNATSSCGCGVSFAI